MNAGGREGGRERAPNADQCTPDGDEHRQTETHDAQITQTDRQRQASRQAVRQESCNFTRTHHKTAGRPARVVRQSFWSLI
mmetsp:Transcript_22830/g.56343  ORF Transcript_22830/g.56343 Transcript_22830/m.56343 type:complete len:81 (-) Transcript_22830:1092-1334(-)